MRRERLYRTEALILRRSDIGEADRLLTVLTPERGKMRLLAKGVRKIASRKAGHVELFTRVHFLVAQGRTWDIVSQAEMVDAFRPLRGDLMRTSAAYYCAELLDRFAEEEGENRPLYDLALATLARLGDERQIQVVLRFFDMHLLTLVGYQPELFQCVRCRDAIQPVTNFWSSSDGGVLCPRCGEGVSHAVTLPLNALKVLRFLQTREWELCRRLQLSPPLHGELEHILHGYIAFILERNLKSVAFLHRLRREMAQQQGEMASEAQADADP